MSTQEASVPLPGVRRPAVRGRPPASPWWGRVVAGLALLALLWQCFALATGGQPLVAVGVLVFGVSALVIYATASSLAWKYLFPGVAGMLLFVAFPLLYTVQIGFTNYSSAHLLSAERARGYLLQQTLVDEERALAFTLHGQPGAWRLRLQAHGDGAGTPGDPAAPAGAAAAPAARPVLVSAPLTLQGATPSGPVLLTPLAEADAATLGPPQPLRQVIALREALLPLELQLPDGSRIQYAGLREFGPVQPLWQALPDGGLKQLATGQEFRPNRSTGSFENAAGEAIQPGFTVGIGFANYTRMLFDADFRGPFVSIFVWTVLFAGLTVLFSTALGMGLAVLLEWPALKGRAVYRTLLFLPYAVPGFISILVFKGLFNQNFGEINAILDALFGVRPAWFADPLLAKVMILIVNTWLGYPYIMILCTGLMKAIPADLYEASAIAGASPWVNFWRITAPLIAKPLTPLLISAFAFNFNNFVLISLLTDGRPDFLNTKLPAGTTDILVSYTYRIAFTDAGQNFGLAAAISTIIFVMVALMALLQLRATQQGKA